MSRVTHFDLAADDPRALIDFYSGVFGWVFEKWENDAFDYWFIRTGEDGEEGINGGVGRSGPDDPVGMVNVIDVRNLDEKLKAVEKAGGLITRPKHAIPGVGWFALFSDPEGIVHGMMETDEKAGL